MANVFSVISFVAGWLSVFSTVAYASILPTNTAEISQSEATVDLEKPTRNLLSKAISLYAPLAKKFGASLTGHLLWENPKVNAEARQEGSQWSVTVFGGFIRHPLATQDAIALTICHELGHLFGGYPFSEIRWKWASSEGQADYFAAQACVRRLWKDQDAENANYVGRVQPFEKATCDQEFEEPAARNLCYRSTVASVEVGRLIADLMQEPVPQSSTPSVDKTKHYSDELHPNSQCRLDTFLAGSRCKKTHHEWVIPGKLETGLGSNAPGSEQLSADQTCMFADGFEYGARPRCWFHPKLRYRGHSLHDARLELNGEHVSALTPGDTAQLWPFVVNQTSSSLTSVTVRATIPTTTAAIDRNAQSIGLLPARQPTTTPKPYQVHISKDAACGSEIPIDFVTTSQGHADESRKWIQVGTPVKTLIEIAHLNANLPDILRTPLRFKIHNSFDADPVFGAEVFIHLEHSFLSDLTISLVDPRGQSRQVMTQRGNNGNREFKKTFTKIFDLENGMGDWYLEISDPVPGGNGTLVQWGLALRHYDCD